jgi:hypothetical protein
MGRRSERARSRPHGVAVRLTGRHLADSAGEAALNAHFLLSQDYALDDLLEVWRVAMGVERGLVGMVLIEQENVGIFGRSICVVELATGFIGADERAIRRSKPSTSSPFPVFAKYFAVRTIRLEICL